MIFVMLRSLHSTASTHQASLRIYVLEYEAIEVLPWGFGAFGRTYGKADAIKEGFSDPVDIRPVLLLNNPEPEADKVTYHPHESRDHAIHDVFNRHGVKVEDPDQR